MHRCWPPAWPRGPSDEPSVSEAPQTTLCASGFSDEPSVLVAPQINPLVETEDKRLVAADAKMNFDDNAAFRQKEIFAMRDPTQEDPREVRCSQQHGSISRPDLARSPL